MISNCILEHDSSFAALKWTPQSPDLIPIALTNMQRLHSAIVSIGNKISGMCPAPCWIIATKNEGSSEGKGGGRAITSTFPSGQSFMRHDLYLLCEFPQQRLKLCLPFSANCRSISSEFIKYLQPYRVSYRMCILEIRKLSLFIEVTAVSVTILTRVKNNLYCSTSGRWAVAHRLSLTVKSIFTQQPVSDWVLNFATAVRSCFVSQC